VSNDIVLGIRITVDGKDATGEIKVAADQFKQLGGAIDQASGKAASQASGLAQLKTGWVNFSAQLYIAKQALDFVTTAAKDFYDRTLGVAASLQAISDRTGIAIENLSLLRHAAEQNNVQIGDIAVGLKFLGRNMAEASKGSGDAANAFKALGLSLTDAGGKLRPTDDMLTAVAESFKAMDDGAEKTALALILFGRSGEQLIPFLNNGRAGLERLKDEARALGMEIDGGTGKAAKQLADDMNAIGNAANTAKMRLAEEFLPGLKNIAEAMKEASKEGSILKTIWVGLGGLGAALFLRGGAAGADSLPDLRNQLTLIEQTITAWERDQTRDKPTGPVLRARILGLDPNAELTRIKGEAERVRGEIDKILNPAGPAPAQPAGNSAVMAMRALQMMQTYATPAQQRAKELAALKDIQGGLAPEDAARIGFNAAQLAAQISEKFSKPGEGAAMIIGLKNELAAFDDQATVTDRVTRELTESGKKFTFQEQMAALAVAGEIDDLKRDKQAREAYVTTMEYDLQLQKEIADVIAQREDQRRAGLLDAQKALETARDDVKLQEYELSLMGKSEQERAVLLAQFKVEEEWRRRINDIKRQGILMEGDEERLLGQAKEASDAAGRVAQIKDSVDEFKSLWSTVESTGKNAFVHLMSDGTSAFKSIGQSLKTAVIDLLYQLTVRKWIINIGASISTSMGLTTAASAANTAAGAAGGAGGLGNLLGLGNSASNLFGAGGGLFGSTAAYSTVLGVGAEQAGMLAAQTGVFGAEGLAATAGVEAAGVGAAGMAAAAIPYVGIAIAVLGALGAFGGSKKIPTQGLGGFTGTYGMGGLTSGAGSPYGGDTASAQGVVTAMYQQFDALAKALGAKYSNALFGYDSNSGKNSQNPNFALSAISGAQRYQVGEYLGSFRTRDDATVQLEMSRGVLTALQGSTLPSYLRKYFDSLVPAAMDKTAIDNALAFAGSLAGIRAQLTETRTPFELAGENLRNMFTGLSTSAASWRDDFKAAIESGLTPDTLARWQALSTAVAQTAQLAGPIRNTPTSPCKMRWMSRT
jgi:hypothetical protein